MRAALQPSIAKPWLKNALDSQARLQNADAIAGDGNLRALGVLEREDDLAGEPRIHLVNPLHIYQRGAVDAQKPGRIKPPLEFGDGLVNAMLASVRHSVGELVAGDKVRDGIQVDK